MRLYGSSEVATRAAGRAAENWRLANSLLLRQTGRMDNNQPVAATLIPPTLSTALADLLTVMERIFDPVGGCAWAVAQSNASIAHLTVEEAYEVQDAATRLDRSDGPEALRDEVGDLLLHVLFHATLAARRGDFTLAEVVNGLRAKLVRRHPHVFGPTPTRDIPTIIRLWGETKAAEKAVRQPEGAPAPYLLDDIPTTLPALTRAFKQMQRSAAAGFKWGVLEEYIAKTEEEWRELKDALRGNYSSAAIGDELGDTMMTLVDLARFVGLNPEVAMRATCDKFERRLTGCEQRARTAGRTLPSLDKEDWLRLWAEVKAEEKKASAA